MRASGLEPQHALLPACGRETREPRTDAHHGRGVLGTSHERRFGDG